MSIKIMDVVRNQYGDCVLVLEGYDDGKPRLYMFTRESKEAKHYLEELHPINNIENWPLSEINKMLEHKDEAMSLDEIYNNLIVEKSEKWKILFTAAVYITEEMFHVKVG